MVNRSSYFLSTLKAGCRFVGMRSTKMMKLAEKRIHTRLTVDRRAILYKTTICFYCPKAGM